MRVYGGAARNALLLACFRPLAPTPPRFPLRQPLRCLAARSGKAPRPHPPSPPPPPASPFEGLLSRLLPQGGRLADRAFTLLLSTPTVPIGAYVAEPAGFAHRLDARVKQALLLLLTFLPGALSLHGKLVAAALVACASLCALPGRVSRPQLASLGLLCALIFLFASFGADGVAPVVQQRSPPDAVLPSLAGMSSYSYTLFRVGPVALTRRGLAFGASSASTTFVILQAAHVALCTTPPESVASALSWFLRPLRALSPATDTAVSTTVLTLLLSLRFTSVVFDTARGLVLGLATRGVDWAALGAAGSAALTARIVARFFANLFDQAADIADASAWHEGASSSFFLFSYCLTSSNHVICSARARLCGAEAG